MDIPQAIAHELDVAPQQVARTIALFDEGNTVPFIARYRKEVTGELDEVQVRTIGERLAYLRTLEARKETVLQSIAEQGKLTPELEAAIREATVRQTVEDLYLPYRPKRRTRATMARERGLGTLAEMILAQQVTRGSLEALARPFLSEDVPTVEDAYAGARDIVAEVVAEDANTRQAVRAKTLREGILVSSQADADADPARKYEMYYDFQERLTSLPAHRLLAINRGESEGALRVKLEAPSDDLVRIMERHFVTKPGSVFAGQLREALHDAYGRLLAPAIARELRAARTEEAEGEAIEVFAANLRGLLLQPPIRGQTVIGIDPGYRTGCKLTVVDATSRYLHGTTIYPHPPQRRWDEALESLRRLVLRYGVRVVAIGNGTASRETESLAAALIGALADAALETRYLIVNEAGASVYSASDLARKELPDLDVAMRGAVSIARRVQDPLAELVKIDPRSIGVGLYQHDVDQKRLAGALDAVVESVVNYVGVDLNTASPALLGHVAGIHRSAAASIVAHRNEHGPFPNREALTAVKGIGDKTYEQAAGFMRIPDGTEPLDNTAIHPESYPAVARLYKWMGVQDQAAARPRLAALQGRTDLDQLAAQVGVGVPTLRDVIEALLKPGRDPRDELPPPVLRQDVLQIEDLQVGMVLKGTVRNVVPFGAFVDIGVKRDGLVHISQLADRYVRDPLEVVSPGDVVQVRVLEVDLERGRIALSMKGI
ncbi:MAG TPA: Tex family protein [Anaerolineae bacterium]|nr:Tex family protein [Anaerolineae bacterium]